VPFGDRDALAAVLKKERIAGVLLEPIQGEAGVVIPPDDYLREAQGLCREHGALIMLDEVQTGLARCGTLFAYQNLIDAPDVLILGKALGGGLIPISATLTTRELHQRAYGSMWKFDLHGSTYSGNALACRVALEVLAMIDDDELAARSNRLGERLVHGLRRRLDGHPLVRDVRGRGLLVGLELGPTGKGVVQRLLPSMVEGLSRQVLGQWLSLRMLERGYICQPASQQWNVLKLTPPLSVNENEIDDAIATIGAVLDDYRKLRPLLADVSRRLGSQWLDGWGFG
jgi:putrescine aminotransferase